MSPATYDANGNATSDEQHTYAWDAYGDTVTADSVSITYDALGRAVELNRSGTYTETVYSPTGFKMLVGGRSYVPLPAGDMAFWTGSGPYIRHSDWLGSSRFASTPSRTMYYDAAYAPFGQPYVESGTTDRNFTGMDQDIVAGLYDFPAREYNSNEGRWPSPDPAGLASVNPADPQTWNRYAYVRNSPLMMTDPTGMDPCPPNAICVTTTEYLPPENGVAIPTPWNPEFCNPYNLIGCGWSPTAQTPGPPEYGPCQIVLANPCGGGGSGGGSPNVSGNQPQTQTQKQQQCDAAAREKQQQTSADQLLYGMKEAGKHVIEATVTGAVTGCLASVEVGCVEGAGAGVITGLMGGFLYGAGEIGYYGFYGIYTSEKQLTKDLAACRQPGG